MLITNTRNTNSISSIFSILFFWLINFCLGLREVFFVYHNSLDFIIIKLALAQLSILGISILLNKVLQQNKMVGVGDVFAGVMFLIFVSAIQNIYEYYKELVGLFLVTLGNNRLVGLYNVNKNYLREFEIGLLFGLSAVIAPGLFPLISIVFIGVSLFVSFTWRDFIVSLLGFIWVFFFKYALFFVSGILNIEIFSDFYFSLPKSNISFDFHQILMVFLLLFQLVTFFRVFNILEKRSLKERVFLWLWIWTFIFLIISSLFFNKRDDITLLIISLSIPCSIFMVEFFPFKRNIKGYWRREFIIYLIIIVQFYLRLS